MKHPLSFLPRVLSTLLPALPLFFLSGCYKTIPEPPEVVNACRITAFGTSNDGTFIPDMLVTYNASGNPTDVSTNPPGQWGVLSMYDMHFRYDAFGRLTDFIINYADAPGAVIWNRYSYPHPGIIVDSAFDYSDALADGPPPTTAIDINIHTYRLDDKDRIISDNDEQFQYDRNGDLIRSGVTYDNKVNIWRTNAVWMFIAQDFSLHNPLNGIATALSPLEIPAYNSYGLPLEFELLPGGEPTELNPNILIGFSSTLQIQYDCSSRNGKGGE